MTEGPPQTNAPLPESRWPGRIAWLLLALSPIALIIMVMSASRSGGQGALQFVAFGLNPLVSCVACYQLLNKPGRDKTLPIAGGIFLGAALATVNFFVGVLGGCACSGSAF